MEQRDRNLSALALLIFGKKFGQRSPVDFHSSYGTEFLAAKTLDTLRPVYDRFLAFHGDGPGWTNLKALCTADALLFAYLRARL